MRQAQESNWRFCFSCPLWQEHSLNTKKMNKKIETVCFILVTAIFVIGGILYIWKTIDKTTSAEQKYQACLEGCELIPSEHEKIEGGFGGITTIPDNSKSEICKAKCREKYAK